MIESDEDQKERTLHILFGVLLKIIDCHIDRDIYENIS